MSTARQTPTPVRPDAEHPYARAFDTAFTIMDEMDKIVPTATVSVITPAEGRLEVCSWCHRDSVVKIVDHDGWIDYACYMHGVEWYPVEMRSVSTLSLIKVATGPDSAHDEWTKVRRMTRQQTARLLADNNLITLQSMIKYGPRG